MKGAAVDYQCPKCAQRLQVPDCPGPARRTTFAAAVVSVWSLAVFFWAVFAVSLPGPLGLLPLLLALVLDRAFHAFA